MRGVSNPGVTSRTSVHVEMHQLLGPLGVRAEDGPVVPGVLVGVAVGDEVAVGGA